MKEPPFYVQIIAVSSVFILSVGVLVLGLYGKDKWLWRSRQSTIIGGVILTIFSLIALIYNLILWL